ncbi:hypothetical protein [Bordetella genomosp. 9]|uniref:hypothetical protein n=1 Tax=Bordetella genomosp. 9 TaxID=1416803 RepID=UPI0012FA058F|nr:hypothetical protein [Bordetella genomosp. 9]
MHPDWTLRVPVVRPRGAAWLDGAVTAAATLAVLGALSWQGLHPLAACGVALALAALAGCLRGPLRRRRAVRAIRIDRDGTVHLRMRQGWQPADWVALWRGPRWLTLRARLHAGAEHDPAAGEAATPPRFHFVTLTVWRDALPAPAWRRVCLLASRRLRRAPAAPSPRAS